MNPITAHTPAAANNLPGLANEKSCGSMTFMPSTPIAPDAAALMAPPIHTLVTVCITRSVIPRGLLHRQPVAEPTLDAILLTHLLRGRGDSAREGRVDLPAVEVVGRPLEVGKVHDAPPVHAVPETRNHVLPSVQEAAVVRRVALVVVTAHRLRLIEQPLHTLPAVGLPHPALGTLPWVVRLHRVRAGRGAARGEVCPDVRVAKVVQLGQGIRKFGRRG